MRFIPEHRGMASIKKVHFLLDLSLAVNKDDSSSAVNRVVVFPSAAADIKALHESALASRPAEHQQASTLSLWQPHGLGAAAAGAAPKALDGAVEAKVAVLEEHSGVARAKMDVIEGKVDANLADLKGRFESLEQRLEGIALDGHKRDATLTQLVEAIAKLSVASRP